MGYPHVILALGCPLLRAGRPDDLFPVHANHIALLSSLLPPPQTLSPVQFACLIPLFAQGGEAGSLENVGLDDVGTATSIFAEMVLEQKRLKSRMCEDEEPCRLPSCHSGYSSVGRASDCRLCRNQMVPGSIPAGLFVLPLSLPCSLPGPASPLENVGRAGLGTVLRQSVLMI